MSKINDKRKKEKNLVEKRRLEDKKKDFALDVECCELKCEICNIKDQIDVNKEKNIRNKFIRNLKISPTIVRNCLPFVLCTTVGIGSSVCLNHLVKENACKYFLETKSVVDSNDNGSYTMRYTNQVLGNIIKSYGKLYLDDDGNYVRDVKSYDIGNINVDKVLDLYNLGEISSLDDIYGDPVETLSVISNKENDDDVVYEDEYIEFIIYDYDKNDYIYVKENFGYKLLIFIFGSCIIFILNSIYILDATSSRKYKKLDARVINKWNELLDRYPEINNDDLISLLDSKIKRYNECLDEKKVLSRKK